MFLVLSFFCVQMWDAGGEWGGGGGGACVGKCLGDWFGPEFYSHS